MMETSITRGEVIGFILKLSFVSAATFFGLKWLKEQMDPTLKGRKAAKQFGQDQVKRLAPQLFNQLSEHELLIAQNIILPENISVSWNNIAGMESILEELQETVILPIQRQELFMDSQLIRPPKGVLLHGPPGCGKTLIAKATAKEAGVAFINLDVSLLTDKWYGESQKLASAVFSLAVKLQPCIIFIDEMDSFLRSRDNSDHEATAMMKAQFMSFWDGLITDPNTTVIIMGATNRPKDLDPAITRRMPASFHVPLPSMLQRAQILSLILNNEPTDENFNVPDLARRTEGFSGSDLKEVCRMGSMHRLRDYLRSTRNNLNESVQSNETSETFHDALRPISMNDMYAAIEKMRRSKIQCGTLAGEIRLD